MFKRYRNPLEKDLSTTPFEPEGATATMTTSNSTATPHQNLPHTSQAPSSTPGSYRQPASRIPPRVYEPQKAQLSSPYTPAAPMEPRQRAPQPQHSETPVAREQQQDPLLHGTLSANEPDTTLGEGVVFKGELTFKRLLRIDGQFEGDLVSDGKLIVGPTGVVKSNVRMHEAIIEGRVEGNITVQERLELRCEAQVIGDIKAKLLSVDEGVSIIGHVAVSAESISPSEPIETPAT